VQNIQKQTDFFFVSPAEKYVFWVAVGCIFSQINHPHPQPNAWWVFRSVPMPLLEVVSPAADDDHFLITQ
jgi:hypothetical protein